MYSPVIVETKPEAMESILDVNLRWLLQLYKDFLLEELPCFEGIICVPFSNSLAPGGKGI
jgi:hypothetical protein